MDPITGVLGKKATDTVWDFVRKLFTRYGDVKANEALSKEVEVLNAQVEVLKAELDEKAEFKRELAGLECRPEDDNIYWSKDGSGAAFCPLCIRGPEKLFTPLTHGTSEGSYYCGLHKQDFETRDLRDRRRDNRSLRIHRATHPRSTHPQSWMR